MQHRAHPLGYLPPSQGRRGSAQAAAPRHEAPGMRPAPGCWPPVFSLCFWSAVFAPCGSRLGGHSSEWGSAPGAPCSCWSLLQPGEEGQEAIAEAGCSVCSWQVRRGSLRGPFPAAGLGLPNCKGLLVAEAEPSSLGAAAGQQAWQGLSLTGVASSLGR